MWNVTRPITSSWGEWKIITVTFLLILIDGLAVLGNTLVIIVVLCTKVLRRKEANLFILSLAVSDLLVALTIVPITIATLMKYRYFLYEAYKNFLGFANFFFCLSSIMNLNLLSLDRYLAIVFPYRYLDFMTRKKACFMCVMVWVYSLAFSLLPTFGVTSFGCFIPNFDTCEEEVWRSYGTLVFAIFALGLTYVLSLVSMTFCYWNIFKVARLHSREIAAQQSIRKAIKRKSNTKTENQIEDRMNKVQRIEVKTLQKTSLPECIHQSESQHLKLDREEQFSAINPRKTSWICYGNKKASSKDCENYRTKGRNSGVFSLQHFPNDKVFPTSSHIESNVYSAKNEMRVARNFLIIIGLYVLCWGPFCFMLAMEIILGKKLKEEASLVCLWIGYINSCVNPFVYTWKYKQFRTALIGLWRNLKHKFTRS